MDSLPDRVRGSARRPETASAVHGRAAPGLATAATWALRSFVSGGKRAPPATDEAKVRLAESRGVQPVFRAREDPCSGLTQTKQPGLPLLPHRNAAPCPRGARTPTRLTSDPSRSAEDARASAPVEARGARPRSDRALSSPGRPRARARTPAPDPWQLATKSVPLLPSLLPSSTTPSFRYSFSSLPLAFLSAATCHSFTPPPPLHPSRSPARTALGPPPLTLLQPPTSDLTCRMLALIKAATVASALFAAGASAASLTPTAPSKSA